jgi:CheY-like chemotaxis protein
MGKILIADDNLNFRLSLKAYLECLAVEVDTVPDGFTALSALSSTFYHLLITDLRMPGMSGFDLARRVRHLSPETRILLITANPLPEPLPSATTTLDGVLSKTTDLDHLKDTVLTLLAPFKKNAALLNDNGEEY